MRQKLTLVGASTGGPTLIKKILKEIQTLKHPLIIAQHMQEEIIPYFIKELESVSAVSVMATPCSVDFYKPAIIVCSESVHFIKKADTLSLECDSSSAAFTPDINRLFSSLAPFMATLDVTVVVMTGIGNDGCSGATKLHKLGAKVFAQDEQSSPVYGMPRAVCESGIVESSLSFEAIKNYLKEQ